MIQQSNIPLKHKCCICKQRACKLENVVPGICNPSAPGGFTLMWRGDKRKALGGWGEWKLLDYAWKWQFSGMIHTKHTGWTAVESHEFSRDQLLCGFNWFKRAYSNCNLPQDFSHSYSRMKLSGDRICPTACSAGPGWAFCWCFELWVQKEYSTFRNHITDLYSGLTKGTETVLSPWKPIQERTLNLIVTLLVAVVLHLNLKEMQTSRNRKSTEIKRSDCC